MKIFDVIKSQTSDIEENNEKEDKKNLDVLIAGL